MNLRPSGYEPDELPDCSIPRQRWLTGLVRHRVSCCDRSLSDRHRLERSGELLVRFGGDLLSHVLRRSTIGATALNGRVRDGIGCFARAVTTKPKEKLRFAQPGCGANQHQFQVMYTFGVCFWSSQSSTGSNQAYRTISTGQLNALLRLHLRPIDVVVYHGPQGYLVLRGASRLDAFSGYPFRS